MQTASVCAFTHFKTIEDYCDAFYKDEKQMLDVTLISIDVNHYIKDWSVFFKSIAIQGIVKTFYMACIGELVMSKSLSEAKHIVEMILMVALSETYGNIENILDKRGKPIPTSLSKLTMN